MIIRNSESLRRRQLVVGVEWRRVASGTAFPLKYLLPALRESVEPVRIRRRPERVNVESQRIKLLIAVARLRAGEASGGDEITVAGKQLRILIERRIAHQVSDRALAHLS